MFKKFHDFSFSLRNINTPLLLFSLVYYIILIFLSDRFNVWEDELYSLNTTSSSFSYALHQSIYFEGQPPVWFLLLTLWRTVSDSILWARLFSMFLIILSQISLYHFARKVSDKKIATIISVLFLLHPWVIFSILEIRLYALVILLSLLIIILFHNTYYNAKTTARKRIFYILAATSGLFTQYFIGFLLVGNALVLIFRKQKREFLIYVLDMLLPLGLVFLYIPHIMLSMDIHTTALPMEQRTFTEFFLEATRLLIQKTYDYILPFSFKVSSFWYWAFRGIVLILLLISFNYTGMKKKLHDLFPFILMSLVIYAFFYMLLYIFSDIYVGNKYTLVLFVTLFLSMLFIFKIFKPGFLYFWLILHAVIYLNQDYNRYHKLYKIRDYRSLATYLEENEKRGEPVFIYRNIGVENLEIYYEGVNKIFPIPEPITYDIFGPEQWKIKEKHLEKLQEQLNNYQLFYIIIDNRINLAGFVESYNLLMGFLFNRYTLIEETAIKEEILVYKFSNDNNQINK